MLRFQLELRRCRLLRFTLNAGPHDKRQYVYQFLSRIENESNISCVLLYGSYILPK